MTDLLKLNCLVLGQFQVTLSQTQSIADLKERIREKKKQTLTHAPANSLVLSKVSVRVDNKFKRNVESLNLVEEESPGLSLPIEELGDIFSPERGCLHVLVRTPRPIE